MVKKIRRTGITRRKSVNTMVSRYGRGRSYKRFAKTGRGNTISAWFGHSGSSSRRGFFGHWPFPRAVAAMFGAKWAKPKKR
jgi:hypothetical protein